MPIQNFLSENSHRSFPFRKHFQELASGSIQQLPNSAIVDFGSLAHGLSYFVAGEHSVWLREVRRTGGAFLFYFASDAPGLDSRELVFSRNVTDDDYVTEYIEAAFDSAEASLSLTDCLENLIWSGYLVTKTMSDLRDVLPTDGMSLVGVATEAITELALTRSLAGTGVRTINIVNTDRTRVTPSDGCQELDYAFTPVAVWTQRTCVRGPILFLAGYNAVIQQNSVNGVMTFGAAVGAGEGEPCEEVSLAVDDNGPLGSSLLSGGLRCDEVVRSINGVSGPHIEFSGGLGVDVSPDPANNRLFVNISLADLAICGNSDALPQESIALPEVPGQDHCGPA